MNTGELEAATYAASQRVLGIQAKLHRWARDDPHRRFDDLFNLVADPAFLLVAWDRVRHNRGAKTAGVDGQSAHYVQAVVGVEEFLARLRASVKDRSFCPVPVREQMIPKAGGKQRRLGIATITDRVVQASLTLVLEPILEADFLPCSYGFRPRRRAHDAIAEARYLAARSYEWIVEGDITACFDEISHPALMDRLRKRIADKRVLALVKAFLKAGILGQDGTLRDNNTGVPQGGIITPPTQWATRRLVTLRVRCLVFLVAVAGSLADGDAVPDGDLLRADEDVFDEEPQDALAFWDAGAAGAGSQLGEESFQVIGEFEVGLLVGELGVQGVELAAQVRLAGSQVRHPRSQLVDGDQLFLERLDHAGDRGGGLGQGEFQPFALPGGRVGGAGPLQAVADLGADQRGVSEQAP